MNKNCTNEIEVVLDIELTRERKLTCNTEQYELWSWNKQLLDVVRLKNIIQCEPTLVGTDSIPTLLIRVADNKPAEEWYNAEGVKCAYIAGKHYLYFKNCDDMMKTYYFIRRHT